MDPYIWICCLHTFLDNKHMTRFGVSKTKKSTPPNKLKKKMLFAELGDFVYASICCTVFPIQCLFSSFGRVPSSQLYMICAANGSLVRHLYCIHCNIYIFITINNERRKKKQQHKNTCQLHNWPVKAFFYTTRFFTCCTSQYTLLSNNQISFFFLLCDFGCLRCCCDCVHMTSYDWYLNLASIQVFNVAGFFFLLSLVAREFLNNLRVNINFSFIKLFRFRNQFNQARSSCVCIWLEPVIKNSKHCIATRVSLINFVYWPVLCDIIRQRIEHFSNWIDVPNVQPSTETINIKRHGTSVP